MHYQLILITDINISSDNFDFIVDTTSINCRIIDENTLNINNDIVYFDYLVINSKTFLNNDFLKANYFIAENNLPITNCYHQTSIDNIFSIGLSSTSSKTLEEQLYDIFEFLKGY